MIQISKIVSLLVSVSVYNGCIHHGELVHMYTKHILIVFLQKFPLSLLVSLGSLPICKRSILSYYLSFILFLNLFMLCVSSMRGSVQYLSMCVLFILLNIMVTGHIYFPLQDPGLVFQNASFFSMCYAVSPASLQFLVVLSALFKFSEIYFLCSLS